MGFSRQEYWSALSFSSPRGLPYPGIEPTSPVLLHSSPLGFCMGSSMADVLFTCKGLGISGNIQQVAVEKVESRLQLSQLVHLSRGAFFPLACENWPVV